MTQVPISAEFTVTQDQIDVWADVADDHNPLHVDAAYAATTTFQGTIAHGHLLIAHVLEVMLGSVGPAWLQGGALRDVRFRAPVRAESVCTFRAEPLPEERGVRAWSFEVTTPSPETTCISGEAVLRAS